MSEINRVKIDSIIESQIPEFIIDEYPIFVEFLKSYYKSQEHQSGVLDLTNNLPKYKNINYFTDINLNKETTLTSQILSFDSNIFVDSLDGLPKTYGLIKIDDEIITYTDSNNNSIRGSAVISVGSTIAYYDNISENYVGRKFKFRTRINDLEGNKVEDPTVVSVASTYVVLSSPGITSTSVYGYNASNEYLFDIDNPQLLNCIRGFSAIDSIKSIKDSKVLSFSSTQAENHSNGSVVSNLSNLFLIEFFKKFKSEFFSGFEGREFNEGISVKNVLLSARDFYSSKGTDQSYKFLFKILYGKDIEILKPQDYTLIPSSNVYFTTKNVLVEKISGGDPTTIRGNFLYQNISGIGTVSASIYNVEYRPVNGKDFYELSLDSNSFSGTFQVSGKTKILNDVPVGSSTILVDSTVGFNKSGVFLVKPENSNFIRVSYTDKTTNQFLGVTGVTKKLDFGLDVVEERFAYSYIGIGNTSKIEFRLVNVIDNVNTDGTSNLIIGDKIKLTGFGKDLRNLNEFNSWMYNIPTVHNISKVDQLEFNKFRIFIYDNVSFYSGEPVILEDINGKYFDGTVINIEYPVGDSLQKVSKQIVAQVLDSTYNFNLSTKLRKKLSKGSHGLNYYPDIDQIPTGVQNTYIDSNSKYFYLTSTGIPNFSIFSTDNKKPISTISLGSTDIFICQNNNFSTGELIYYSPYMEDTSGISTGSYYVTTVSSSEIKLSYSKSDIFSKKYLSTSSVGISSATVIKSGYENKILKNQKLLKKFPIKKQIFEFDDINKRTTKNREIGILLNGVEVLSPTVFDENIFYGQVESVKVSNSGKDYDIVNSPSLEVIDLYGTGAKLRANIVGDVKKVKIISPGVGYKEKPKISLTGGGGEGCVLESNLVSSRIFNDFNGRLNVNTIDNTIEFFDRCLFFDNEEIIYDSNGNSNIGGLVSGSRYFIGVIGEKRVKIYNTQSDAILQINEIDLTTVSTGTHLIQSLKNKNTITEIYVKNSGQNYSNRSIAIPSQNSADNKTVGINTFDSYLFAKNHNFKEGDIVKYSSTDTVISGLSTTENYYITVIDPNKFRLSYAGDGQSSTDYYYKNKIYSKFNSLGVGTHIVSYPPIEIKVESVSIGSTAEIVPIFEPLVLGSISDVYVETPGVGYGCTDIINFHRRPYVGITSVKTQAIISPIIINGSIVDVKIISRGNGYRRDSDIIVTGSGKYAEIIPNIDDNGKLSSVDILNGGAGYKYDSTNLTLKNRGTQAQFLASVKEWKINQVIKSSAIISRNDEGILYPSKNIDLELKFVNFYVPPKLRYQVGDNFTSDNLETNGALRHSPILGYAYDGNPIYGPYGYSTPYGGSIKLMNSSYILNRETDAGIRPQTKTSGYFIDDYEYDSSGDLDENNGRFCITPEYPDGVYAYFSSISVDTSKRSFPRYPYIIGPTFKDSPIEENFIPKYNQDLDIFTTELTRNTSAYYANYANSYYDLFEKVTDNLKQEFRVSQIDSYGLEPKFIISPGDNYKIGDRLILNRESTSGSPANIVVSQLNGRVVDDFSLIDYTIEDVNFIIQNYYKVIGKTSSPHELLDNQPISISGVSTVTSSILEGISFIKVENKSTNLSKHFDIDSVTGISTFIVVNNVDGFKPNSFIRINDEKLLITRISKENSAFYVNRLENTSSHSANDTIELLPTEFEIVPREEIRDITFENKVTFFDPKESVGTGTTGVVRYLSGIGVSSIEERFLPSKNIYIPNHNFKTGEQLIYDCGIGGTTLLVKNVGSATSFRLQRNQTVYAVNFGIDFVGLSTIGFTSTSGIGTSLNSLEFLDITDIFGTVGYSHSLSNTNLTITGTINQYSGIITTRTNHNLVQGDFVDLKVIPKTLESIKVIYDFVNRKVALNEISFTNSEVSTINDEIELTESNYNVETGSKVVYISTNVIGGLVNYGIYYVLKTKYNTIKLCESILDVNRNNYINFTSSGGSDQKLYFIGLPLTVNYGNKITFDLSDPSLFGMDLEFYKDSDFNKKLEIIGTSQDGFAIRGEGTAGNSGAYVEIDTFNEYLPPVFYYNLAVKTTSDENKKQISPDDLGFLGRNKISIRNHPLTSQYQVNVIDENTFSISPSTKLNYLDKLNLTPSLFEYSTNSTNALGPIKNLKVNYGGVGYKKLPFVESIESELGTNGVVKILSTSIGKIKSLDRIKDGFDYPTDPTLSPSLTIPTVVGVKNIRTIDYIGIVTGGRGYNTNPTLLVKDSTNIKLSCGISGGSVTETKVDLNSTELEGPLEIISIRNSNGHDIDAINVNTNLVTLELLNTNYITVGYGNTQLEYPFAVGDYIFIENCRLTNLTKALSNFNSSSYDYSFFPVVGVSTANNTVTYDMTGISTGYFGTYDSSLNTGTVINKKNMAVFEMILKDDVNYLSRERVDSTNFGGRVMENGWNGNLNILRLTDCSGTLVTGDKIRGEDSKINGTVEFVQKFELNSTLGLLREKIGVIDNTTGILNESQQKISDNFYYQKFAYSIKSEIPYTDWRESVRSTIHPSGFKEFSDLLVYSQPTYEEVKVGISKSTDLKARLNSGGSKTFINIDNIISMNLRNNFATVYEEGGLPDGTSSEDVFLYEGTPLLPFILNKTNKVVNIDDISDQFDGTSTQELRGRFVDASELLNLNRYFIQEEVVGFITSVYPGITTNPDWDRSICARDVGYIVDAISQDVKYGSNNKSVEAGLAYWSGLGTSYVAGESVETIAGFKYIIDLSKYIINNVGVKTSYQLGDSISISTAFYNNVTGVTTITTTSPHGFSTTTTNYVLLKDIVFSCNSGGGLNTAIFPNTGNGPDGNGPLSPKGFVYQVEVIDAIKFRVNPGPSTITHNYVSGGTIQEAFISTTQYIDPRILFDTTCNSSYDEDCCADVWTTIGNYVGIITSIIGIGTTAKPNTITYPSLTKGGIVVGLTTFKLRNNGTSLFKHSFDSSSSSVINLSNNSFIISNHNYQTGQKLIYDYGVGTPIGIGTTTYVENNVGNIITSVGSPNGTSLYENGYNVAISTTVTGVSTVLSPVGPSAKIYNQVKGTNGVGISTFNVLISYSISTGQPLSTSIVLTDGGNNFAVGDTVSIAGTYIGGTSPTNNLTFVVSSTKPTKISSGANTTYSSISDSIGNAVFNISRDNNGYVSNISVVNGGSGYAITSIVSIAGTNIGGYSSADDISFYPTILASDQLPQIVYVYKINDNEFRLSGLSTSLFLDLSNYGSGEHSLTYYSPNSSVLITVDGIIQKPLTSKLLNVSLASPVSTASTTIISVSSGISSLISNDIININNEYLLVKSIGINSTNFVEVERGFFGSLSGIHTVGASATILSGDFNIIDDTLYFSSAPYGKVGPVGLETGSSFSGRFFSRAFDASQSKDGNIILDDISKSFTGIAATEFTLTSGGNTTQVLFNDVNSGTDSNNNPIILINNIFQVPQKDYIIDGSSENTIKFISGTPKAGKITKVATTTGFGYQPLLPAAGQAIVSAGGTISSITLTGGGFGYRQSPTVSIASTIGFGASITSIVSAAGTVIGFNIVNPGSGYTTAAVPEVRIGIPTGYSHLGVAYTGGTSGTGQGLKVIISVGQGSSITSFAIDDPGRGYKPGDILYVPDLSINTGISTTLFEEFRIVVQEIETDTFSGFYPGQFILFDSITSQFNGIRKKFTLKTSVTGQSEVLTLKTPLGSDLDIANNLVIFINDVLQVPNSSYTIQGSRVFFKESPKENSTCTILYYRGSSVDVELVSPPQTVKSGDTLTIGGSDRTSNYLDQFDRSVKTIYSPDTIKTFPYDGPGITTSNTTYRPANYKLQTQDRIVNGERISKERSSLKSNIRPTANLIKPVTTSDTVIYVDNAFPLFSNVDTLTESLRDVILVEDKDFNPAVGLSSISRASTISGVSIVDGGTGYAYTESPKVLFSESKIIRKDPIYDWNSSYGIPTTYELNSITYDSSFVAVGNESALVTSVDGEYWQNSTVGFGTTVNLEVIKSIGLGNSSLLVAAGSGAKIIKAIGYSNTISSWTQSSLYDDISVPGFGVIGRTQTYYNGTLKDIVYGAPYDTFVTVGTAGSIFVGSGISTDVFTNRFSQTLQDLNSVSFSLDSNYFIAVGNNGVIVTSSIGQVWDLELSPTLYNLNNIIYQAGTFIIVGDNGVVITSTIRGEYTLISTNISVDFVKINYNDGVYVAIDSNGDLYYSFDLGFWVYRDNPQSNTLRDLIQIPTVGINGRYVFVGSSGTSIYSEPIYHRASGFASVSGGIVTSVTITDGGFGYDALNPPPVIIEPDRFNQETLLSIKAKGDFGTIIGITTFVANTAGIGTTTPKIEFVLQPDSYDNNTLGIGYSSLNNFGVTYTQLEKGDYFVISNSNVSIGHSLVGITTLLGGMSNYPTSKVGTAVSFIDGVYIVEQITEPDDVGIVTVTCNFAPKSPTENYVEVYSRGQFNTGVGTNNYYGRYSWSKIYDYQNRSIRNPQAFSANVDNGIIGLSTSSKVIRTKGLLSN
jgi:hypothetical protein